MQDPLKHKRSAGTGSLIERNDRAGRVTYYAQWRIDRRQVKRRIGRKRSAEFPTGLTQKQAEKQLRKLMEATTAAPPTERVTLKEAGERLRDHLEAMGRKPSTVGALDSALRVHLVPFFGGQSLDRITRKDIERFIYVKGRTDLSPKSLRNFLSNLHSIFEFGMRQEWVHANPCKLVDKPQLNEDPDIRYLTQDEIEALIGGVPDDTLGSVERVLYRAAAMTGMRQGELFALRWSDVDWASSRIRVRRTYARGVYSTPKSRRSIRSVPLADRLAGELERHFQASAWTGDDDLVFPHPVTGTPLDSSKILKRLKDALGAAGLREVRFHDLRHSFATAMAGAGVPMRTLQEWMGHRDFATTLRYADYAPSAREAEWIEAAFGEPVSLSPLPT